MISRVWRGTFAAWAVLLSPAGAETGYVHSVVHPLQAVLSLQPRSGEADGASLSYDLLLDAGGGHGCDRVSTPRVTERRSADGWDFSINGYDLDRFTGGGSCPGVEVQAQRRWAAEHLLGKSNKTVLRFTLGAKENRFLLTQDAETLRLAPLSSLNVLAASSADNAPARIRTIVAFRYDALAVLHLDGTFYSDSDYTGQLKILAAKNGLRLAKDFFPGFPSMASRSSLCVLRPQRGPALPRELGAITAPIPIDPSKLHTVNVILAPFRLTAGQYSYRVGESPGSIDENGQPAANP